MTKKIKLPEVIEKSQEELDGIIKAIKESSLSYETKEFVINCINLALWLPRTLQKSSVTLHRLRLLLFGKGYKNNNKHPNNDGSTMSDDLKTNFQEETESCDESQNKKPLEPGEKAKKSNANESSSTSENNNESKKPGHGRMSHSIYENYTHVDLSISNLSAGDFCPLQCGGKLYMIEPGVIVRIRGKHFADVYKYHVEKLRCALCGYYFTADIPSEVGSEKYDEAFKSWLVLQKYYMGVPFYRQEAFGHLVDFPLPDATQWDLVEKAAGSCIPAYLHLEFLAAQGKRVYNDDTHVKILEVIKQIKDNPEQERTGMNTTGIISDYQGHQIALFINGSQHAGENLEDVLKKRLIDKPPLQMCDGLSANIPKNIKTIVCNCLSHGFRKFSDLLPFFPDESITIMRLLSAVFKQDEKTKTMNDDARLQYHQEHSRPIMDELKSYMASLLDDHIIEPNNPLGQAINYMQKRWEKLTQFLHQPGAALDNNLVERALKIAIRNRKSAMFYRSRYSASIGGMLTSLIYTCLLAKENAFNYITALQKNTEAVLNKPQEWMPWNYQKTLAALEEKQLTPTSEASNHQLPLSSLDSLVAI